jgi:hypothetical protein
LRFLVVTAPRRFALGTIAAARRPLCNFILERKTIMRRLFLGSIFAGLLAAVGGLFAFAGPTSKTAGGCGCCADCQCPDCDGQVCTCEVCGCADCGCVR